MKICSIHPDMFRKFVGYARTIILLIILSMAMNGPAANVLENVQRVTNSSACGVQVVMNQTIEIVERVREPLRRSAARPVLKFSPNYSTIFKGEKIKMTCDSQPKEMEYAWFFNNEKIGGNKGNIYEIPSANVMQSGNYHCQTPDGSKSEMVTLNVTEGQLILQTALYIHEGDRLILKCHHNPGITGSQSKFYKNKAELINLNNDPLFMVSDITMNASGLYSCIKELSWGSWSSQSTVYATIKVKA